VGSDERLAQFRHPLPTNKRVKRLAMLVLCCRIGGLVAALTRFVHFGPIDEELMAKAHTIAHIDAEIILATLAGRTMGDLYEHSRQAYTEAGYPSAINEHHQGGSIAYLSREVLATPDNPTVIAPFQAFAWNPSIPGMKSEDTVLLTEQGPEVLTSWPEWPTVDVTINGQTIQRPAIFVH
jgi:Xaa-Pro aminopeptidase